MLASLSAFASVISALVLAQPAPEAGPSFDRPRAGAPTRVTVSLEWPARGTVTDRFGPRWGRMHLGLDIGVLQAPAVTAAASGVVSDTGWLAGYEGYGKVVIVDVGSGYRTMYAHLSRIDVRSGTWVEQGERLGAAGCTGSCTGTHLHFELHRGTTPVDPMPFLAR